MDTGDDALIRALQERAWHPGKRLDETRVPAAWLAERHGPDYRTVLTEVSRGFGPDGSLWLAWDAAEIDEYFADAPRGPLFAPASPALVESAEAAFGHPFPELLRRVCLEVGDGGFGPGEGVFALAENRRQSGWISDQPSAVGALRDDRRAGLPSAWFRFAHDGCTMQWRVSLNAVDAPVLLYDSDGWVPEWGETPHDAVHAAIPLREWLRRWAEGEPVYDFASSSDDGARADVDYAEIGYWRSCPWADVYAPARVGTHSWLASDRVPFHHTSAEYFHWRGRAYRGDFTGTPDSLRLSAQRAGDLGELLRWLLPGSRATVATSTAGPIPVAEFLVRLDAGDAF